MSNKAISVYVAALKRQQEEEGQRSSSTPQDGFAVQRATPPGKPIARPVDSSAKHAELSSADESSAERLTMQAEKSDHPNQFNESMQANMQESKLASKQAYLQSFLNRKATNTATFRFPLELLERIEEVHYLVRKRFRTKVTRNSVVVAAVAFLLWDFEKNGKDSTLYRLLVERQG